MSESSTSLLQGWIERMNANDPGARDALIRHAYDRLRRLTRKLFRDFRRLERWEEADDVLQGALVRLLNALEQIRPASAAEFFRLATLQIRRELLDLVRHHFGPEGSAAYHASGPPGERNRDSGPPAHDAPQTTYLPDRLAIWAELHRRIAALRPELRDVFELRWYQGLTQEQTAAVLGVSVPTVKRRWTAGRLELAEFLGDS
jgi:RNA polymerase sigma-70 factor (ECF subfamily)